MFGIGDHLRISRRPFSLAHMWIGDQSFLSSSRFRILFALLPRFWFKILCAQLPRPWLDILLVTGIGYRLGFRIHGCCALSLTKMRVGRWFRLPWRLKNREVRLALILWRLNVLVLNRLSKTYSKNVQIEIPTLCKYGGIFTGCFAKSVSNLENQKCCNIDLQKN